MQQDIEKVFLWIISRALHSRVLGRHLVSETTKGQIVREPYFRRDIQIFYYGTLVVDFFSSKSIGSNGNRYDNYFLEGRETDYMM